MDQFNSAPNSLLFSLPSTAAAPSRVVNPNVSGIGPVPVSESFNGTGPFFSAAEIEFMAENTLISIKPLIQLEDLDLLSVKLKWD